MRIAKSEQEIERNHFRALVLIVATFVIANLALIIGFTASAGAQTMESAASVMQLARMLAAPDAAPDLIFGSTRFNIFGAMAIGFLAMVVGLIALTKNLMRDLGQPERSKF